MFDVTNLTQHRCFVIPMFMPKKSIKVNKKRCNMKNFEDKISQTHLHLRDDFLDKKFLIGSFIKNSLKIT